MYCAHWATVQLQDDSVTSKNFSRGVTCEALPTCFAVTCKLQTRDLQLHLAAFHQLQTSFAPFHYDSRARAHEHEHSCMTSEHI